MGKLDMKKIVALVSASIIVAGCASNYGAQSVNDFNRYMQLQQNVSTKADIYETFGQPHGVLHIEETGGSIWRYASIQDTMNALTFIPFVGLVAGGSNVDITTAEFFFNSDGVYEKAERAETSRYRNMWLAMGDMMTTNGQVESIRLEMESLGFPFDEQLARNDVQNLDANE